MRLAVLVLLLGILAVSAAPLAFSAETTGASPIGAGKNAGTLTWTGVLEAGTPKEIVITEYRDDHVMNREQAPAVRFVVQRSAPGCWG